MKYDMQHWNQAKVKSIFFYISDIKVIDYSDKGCFSDKITSETWPDQAMTH